MSDGIGERRLAAIILGDVVGYSRLMGLDEVGTMTALKAHRRDLILPALAAYRGRMVGAPGDAMLIEFGSAVEAVTCAVTIQRKMMERNIDVPEDRRLWFRLGINLGDIISDGEDIYGDGVNVAARLEALCQPGGVCISRSIEEQIRGKLRFKFADGGEQALKNIVHPVQIFRLPPDVIAELPDHALPTPRTKGLTAVQARIGPGTLLNDTYEIEAPIGRGGMGEIFKGHEIHSGGLVAIKLVRLDMVGNKTALALFQKEALILKDIHHDAVVGYYSFSSDPAVKRHYLAMEYVDGIALSDLARRGPLPFESISALCRRVASGLAVAHQRGIVHRDVSPDNIIVPAQDVRRAKIIDFGIARAADVGGGTIIGDGFAGKYNYVSPEQLGMFGSDVTFKSDIYSLGLVLAEASLGGPLDMGGTQAEVIEKRRNVPDLQAIEPRLRALLERMLQPEPIHRPGSMDEVAAWSFAAPADRPATPDAPRVSARPGSPGPSTRPKPDRHIERWIIGSTLVVALLSGIGFALEGSLVQPRHPAGPVSSPPSLPGPTQDPPKPPTQSPPVDPPAPSADAIRTYIKDYDGGDCFFARPVRVTDKSAAISGFAQSKDVFSAFAQAFTQTIRFEPDLVGNRIWSHQCPALDFMRRVGASDTTILNLFLKSSRIGRGEPLAGEVRGVTGLSVALLQVDEDGTVRDVSSALKSDGDTETFEFKPARDGTGGPFPQLLIAIASQKSLATLAGPDPKTADRVFRSILDETAHGNDMLSIDAKLFLTGG